MLTTKSAIIRENYRGGRKMIAQVATDLESAGFHVRILSGGLGLKFRGGPRNWLAWKLRTIAWPAECRYSVKYRPCSKDLELRETGILAAFAGPDAEGGPDVIYKFIVEREVTFATVPPV